MSLFLKCVELCPNICFSISIVLKLQLQCSKFKYNALFYNISNLKNTLSIKRQRIINRVENDPHYARYLNQLNIEQNEQDASEAITLAAKNIARTIDAKAIVVFTCRGSTAIRSSRSRPGKPIVAISPFRETARQLALCWGVYPDLPKAGSYGYDLKEDNYMYAQELADDDDETYVEEAKDDFDLILRNACRAVLKKGLVSNPNDLMVVTAGMPFGTPGAANVIRIIPAAGPSCWDGLCRV